MSEKFGFVTKKFSVLKAYENDAREISKLYMKLSPMQRRIIELQWQKILRERKDDLYENVVFMVKDNCNKVLGIIETGSQDGYVIEIGIWIPNKAKEKRYLDDLVDYMIEWSKIDEYEEISAIRLITENSSEEMSYNNIMTHISLVSAS